MKWHGRESVVVIAARAGERGSPASDIMMIRELVFGSTVEPSFEIITCEYDGRCQVLEAIRHYSGCEYASAASASSQLAIHRK